MQKKFLIGLFLLISSFLNGQNLFSNPGFEQYTLCPDYTSQIVRCTNWENGLGTADYFNCSYYGNSTIGNYGIPATGNGVVGLIAGIPNSPPSPSAYFYGETFRGNLLSTLENGASYELKADFLYNTVQLPPPGPCFQIGFYFYKSSNPPASLPGQPFGNPYRAQVSMPADQVPVGSYATFTFSYIPDSCYDAVMIGLFSNDSTTGTGCINNAGSFYFDVDNISMQKIGAAPIRTTVATVQKNTICTNECINFSGNSNLIINTWKWEFPGAITTLSTLQNPLQICYPTIGNYDVTLITTYECGVDTIYLPANINVKTVPSISVTTDSTSHCYGTSKTLYAGSTDGIKWNNGSSGSIHIVTEQGIYTATATNECGVAIDSIQVEFENCPCEVFLPNAFTPDDDGNNDLFAAVGECVINEFQLSIYDRWGSNVFSSNDLNTPWDGRYNGEACPQGIYAVILSWTGYRDHQKKGIKKSGYLALLR